jgi:hypothetical protein
VLTALHEAGADAAVWHAAAGLAKYHCGDLQVCARAGGLLGATMGCMMCAAATANQFVDERNKVQGLPTVSGIRSSSPHDGCSAATDRQVLVSQFTSGLYSLFRGDWLTLLLPCPTGCL